MLVFLYCVDCLARPVARKADRFKPLLSAATPVVCDTVKNIGVENGAKNKRHGYAPDKHTGSQQAAGYWGLGGVPANTKEESEDRKNRWAATCQHENFG